MTAATRKGSIRRRRLRLAVSGERSRASGYHCITTGRVRPVARRRRRRQWRTVADLDHQVAREVREVAGSPGEVDRLADQDREDVAGPGIEVYPRERRS